MLPDLSLNGLAFGGVLLGAVAALWSRLKTLAWRVANLAVAQLALVGDAELAVRAYLWTAGRRSRFGEKRYGGYGVYVRPAGRWLSVLFEMLGTDTTVFWVGWCPLLARTDHRKLGADNAAEPVVTLTFLRGTFDEEGLLRDAVAAYNAAARETGKHSRYQVERVIGRGRVASQFDHPEKGGPGEMSAAPPAAARPDPYRYLGWAAEDLGEPLPADPFEFLAYPPEGAAVLADARWWLAAEAEYKSRGVPWRMGIGLTGPPGTGKSSLVRAVAQALGLPLYVVELATMTDQELVRAWKRARDNGPAVVLIEDVDTVFEGRRVVEGGPEGLSFGCLLNCLSGVESADGVLVFVTTNRPETLDPALGAPDPAGRSTRPGRIDRLVVLGPLDAACRERVAAKVLAGFPADAAELAAAHPGTTGAQFQQVCVERAFELLRRKRAETAPGPNPDR